MRLRHYFAIIFLASSCASSHAQQQTGDALIAKCLAAYQNCKTYQGSLFITSDRGGANRAINIQVKAEVIKGGDVARTSLSMSQSIQESGKQQKLMQLFIDDGSKQLSVDQTARKYIIGPHRPDKITGLFGSILDRVKVAGGTVTVINDTYRNQPVYRIKQVGKSDKAEIIIDRKSYLLYSVVASSTSKKDPYKSAITLSDQVLDKTIDPSTFVWNPPVGYTKSGP